MLVIFKAYYIYYLFELIFLKEFKLRVCCSLKEEENTGRSLQIEINIFPIHFCYKAGESACHSVSSTSSVVSLHSPSTSFTKKINK